MGFINLFSCRNQNVEQINQSGRNENEDQSSSKRGYFTQFIAGFSIYFLSFNHGVYAAWTSPALPYLQNSTSDLRISDEEGAWIAAIPSLGSIAGTLLSPLFLDRIGRKHTITISAIPNLISWIMIIFWKNYLPVCIARFICGLGSGITYGTAMLYFAEIGSKEIRGVLITLINICGNLGILFVVSIGTLFSYDTMNIIMTFIPFLGLLSIPLMPKTPYFLLIKNDESRAEKNLMKLRGVQDPEKIRFDIERIKSAVMESRNLEKTSLREFFGKGNRKGLIILFFATAAMYLSGVSAIEAYSEDIFSHSSFDLSPKYSTIVLGVVRIFAGLLSTLFIDRGRKLMFLISGTLSAISLAVVGVFYFLDSETDYDASSITWLPLAGLIAYLLCGNLGLMSIPAIYMGELFSIRAKGKAVAVGIVFAGFFSFASKFWFQELKSHFGMYTPFWTFALCCIVSTMFVFWIAPETSGKNLEEVQKVLKKKKVQVDNLELDSISSKTFKE